MTGEDASPERNYSNGNKSRFADAFLSILFLLLCAGAAGQQVFVDKNSTKAQTGLSWANALHEVDDGVALAAALGYSEVWVAGGTYQKPVTMRDGVAVYGGFAGTETQLGQRDVAAHATVIDVSRADAGAPTTHGVVIVNAGSVALDGFTITGGAAIKPTDHHGGGIFCSGEGSGLILIANCTVTGNTSNDDGGGLYAEACELRISDCVFTNNRAMRGGGVYVCVDATAQISRCVIQGNQGQTGGGAEIDGVGTSLNECRILGNHAGAGGGVAGGGMGVTLRNCAVLDNVAVTSGGGVLASGGVCFYNSMIGGNQAALGGGICCGAGGWIGASECVLAGNTASGWGGGLFNAGVYGLYQGWLDSCTISGNRATEGGGVVLAAGLELRDCIISGNRAARGGGMAWEAPGVDVFGCTLSDNLAGQGGGAYAPFAHDGRITNSVFSGNSGYAVFVGDNTTSGVMLHYSLFHGNGDGDFWDGQRSWNGARQINSLVPRDYGNIEGDPRFTSGTQGHWSAPAVYDAASSRTTLHDDAAAWVPDTLAGRLLALGDGRTTQALVTANTATELTLAGDWTGEGQAGLPYEVVDYHLASGSYALERGMTTPAQTGDIDREERPGLDEVIDLGADEADESVTNLDPPVVVDDTAPVSQAGALPPLIRVPVIGLNLHATDDSGSALTLRLFYRINGTTWTQAATMLVNSGSEIPCMFDSTQAGGCGYYEFYTTATDLAGNTEAVPMVADAATTISLPYRDGCVYVDAAARGVLTGEEWDSALNSISDAIAIAQAVGVSTIRVMAGTYHENIMLPNTFAIYGGYYLEKGTIYRDPLTHPTVIAGVPVTDDPTMQPSVATLDGLTSAVLDGLWLTHGDNALGGGLLIRGGNPSNIVNNCVITGNHASNAAGIFIDLASSPTLTGCRIIGNIAEFEAGGVGVDNNSEPALANCIVAGNVAGVSGGGMAVGGRSAPSICNSTFSSNAAMSGGAIVCELLAGQSVPPVITNSIFKANRGVAIAEADAGSDPAVRYCLFDANPDGDYLNEGTTVLTGAAAINPIQPLPRGNISGAAAFAGTQSGRWTAAPVYDALANRTILTNAGASFTTMGLVGQILTPKAGQVLQAMIVANTPTTVEIASDILGLVNTGDTYGIDSLRPGAGSAAVDRVNATEAPPWDIDGNRRPYDVKGLGNDGGSSTYDLGACEAMPRLAIELVDPAVVLNLGSLSFGETSTPVPIRLVNQGTVPLNFTGTGISIGGTNPLDFAVNSGLTTTPLAAGASRTLTVVFSPTGTGTRRGRLTITTDDLNQPSVWIALRGTGLASAPLITGQPVAQTVKSGAVASFTINVVGSPPLSYVWMKDGVALTTSGQISGVDAATLSISGVQLADEGVYSCLVSNSFGSVESSGARLALYRQTLHIGAGSLGNPNPPVGDHVYTSGTLITASITNPTILDSAGTSRSLCTGWSGAGSPQGPPTATLLTFKLDAPSTVTWLWLRQFYLDATPSQSDRGAVAQNGGGAAAAWVDADANVSLQAVAQSGYLFAGWEGDLTGTSNPVQFVMDRPIKATARFLRIDPDGKITINGGAASTSSTEVILTLLANDTPVGVDKMRLSNDGVTWSGWVPFAVSYPWTLATGNGVKTVYAQFQDTLGTLSNVISSSIVLAMVPPQITGQPVAQMVKPGGMAVFATSATGTPPLSYRWKKDGVDLNNGGQISGADTATLSISGVQLADEGDYSCLVSNSIGSVESSGARLALYRQTLHIGGPGVGNPDPPVGDYVFTSGTLITVSVANPLITDSAGTSRSLCTGWSGTGSPQGPPTSTTLTFRLDEPSTVTWLWKQQFYLDVTPNPVDQGKVNLPGIGAAPRWIDTGATVTLQAVAEPGTRFAGWGGDLAAETTDLLLFQMNRPVLATAQFELVNLNGKIVINGGAAYATSTDVILTLTPNNPPAGVDQMRLSNDGVTWSGWVSLAPSYPWSLTPGNGLKTVYAQFLDLDGNSSNVISSSIFLAIVRPQIMSQPAGQTVDPGGTATFAVTATGTAPLTYQWKKNGSDIPGATLDNYTIISAAMADAALYTCVVTNAAGWVASSAARLVVNPTLTVASAYGAPAPAIGAHVYTSGTLVNATLSGSPIVDTTGTTRLVCSGWTGSGSVAASGATTQTSFNLRLDSALAWQWKTQHKLTATANPAAGGRVTLSDGVTTVSDTWHDAATVLTLKAVPASGYLFTGWSGDASGSATTVSLAMSRPHAVTASFVQPGTIGTSPASLSFLEGSIWAVDVERGGAPTSRVVRLTNTGGLPVTFTGGSPGTPGLALTDRCAADFAIQGVVPSTATPLAPGGSIAVTIRFAPKETRRTLRLDATLRVTTDSPLTPTINLPLLGDAVPVELSGFKVE